MSTVYQHQLHAHKVRRRHYKRWLVVIAVVAGAVVFGLNQLKPDTKISQSKATTKKVSGNAANQTFHKGTFSIQLPTGWQFMSVQKDLYTIYHFRSTLGGDQGNRSMDIYEDSSLPNFAINRMIPVEANGEGGLIADNAHISENCTNYTTGGPSGNQNGQLAKWQGIEFMCDMGNTLRNVVGIGSTDGRNMVNVKSLSTGTHHYFMTYTENNDKPDYDLFVAAIDSFKVDQ